MNTTVNYPSKTPPIKKMSIKVEKLSEATPLDIRFTPVIDIHDVMGHLPSRAESCPESQPCTFGEFDSPFTDDDIATPLLINPSVLDSVFSSVLDDHSGVQDHSPMFDDLELGPESEWDLLFAGDSSLEMKSAPLVEFSPEEQILSYSAKEREEEKPGRKRLHDSLDRTTHTTPIQIATPLSTPLSTPVLDASKKPKLDKFGCVAYSKKQRSRPLEPIEPAGCDPISLKRAKNTEAARRSRARKMERMGQLEEKIEVLVSEKQSLSNEIDRLRQLLTENNVSF